MKCTNVAYIHIDLSFSLLWWQKSYTLLLLSYGLYSVSRQLSLRDIIDTTVNSHLHQNLKWRQECIGEPRCYQRTRHIILVWLRWKIAFLVPEMSNYPKGLWFIVIDGDPKSPLKSEGKNIKRPHLNCSNSIFAFQHAHSFINASFGFSLMSLENVCIHTLLFCLENI